MSPEFGGQPGTRPSAFFGGATGGLARPAPLWFFGIQRFSAAVPAILN